MVQLTEVVQAVQPVLPTTHYALQAWDGCSTSRPLSQGGTARHTFSNALPRINSFRPAARDPRHDGSAGVTAGLPMSSPRGGSPGSPRASSPSGQHAEGRHPL